jgi:hypothetical protein
MLNNFLKSSLVVAVAWMVTYVPYSVQAAEWGSLKGRIIVDGTPAKPAPLAVDNKDQFCLDKKPVNETLVLGKDNALVNAVVYLRLPTGQKVEIHPDYEAKLKEPAVLDNNACSFKPHITLVRKGQPLTIKNSDPVGHNTNISIYSFNQTIPANDEIKINASAVAPLPMPVVCNIHSFMKAHVVSLDHPYMAATGDDGSFEIKNVPAGPREFQFWHEISGYLKNVKLKGAATDARGRAKLTIPAGQTLDLGDIKIPASALK